MPLNRPNPAYPRPSPYPYLDQSGVPTGDPGKADAPAAPAAAAPVTNVDIAPAGSAAAPAPAAPATATTATTTGPAAGPPSPSQTSVGGYTVAQIAEPLQKELDDAHTTVNTLWTKIDEQTKARDKAQAESDTYGLTAATSTLNSLYGSLSSALQRVETANAAQATAINTAIHNGTVDPSQVQTAQATADKATADAGLANTQAKVLLDGADTQKALVSAQAATSAQQGLLAKAQADAQIAKTPAEKSNLEAQAAALLAQANQTNALLPGLEQKQKDDSSLTQANVGLTDANSDLAKANTASVNADAALKQAQLAAGLPAAQVAATQGQGAQAQAAAAASQADIQKGLLGPVYGLQDQIKAIQAIQQQVFGPGGSGDPNEASDLLKQYTTASLAGTTPYAANVAAANAGLTAFGTQASLANAAQAAAASRANAYTGFGGSVLGTLAQMNANAPKGSTALAAAFGDVMNQMQGRLQAPQFAGPATPTTPNLPALLQKLAPPGGPAGPPVNMPTGPALPGPAAAPVIPPASGAPQTSAPVTINIGGGNPAPGGYVSGMNMSGMPGAGPQGQQSTALPQTGLAAVGQGVGQSMPGVLQNYAAPSSDFVHQLWGNELGSGAVRSPYAAMGQGA